MTKKDETAFDAMPPKFAFWAGFVTAIALASVVGLVAVTSVLLDSNDDTKGTSAKADTAVVDTAGTDTADAVAPTAAVPEGTIEIDSLRNVKGEGEITLVEYSDFECPFCQRFHPTMQQVVEEFDGQVQWAYKHFPLNIHPNAQSAAEASECAADQGKFWEFGDKLITAASLSQSAYESIADEVGLDRAAFDDCVSGGEKASVVQTDAAEAQKYGGQGTPHTLVIDSNGEILTVISGAQPYEAVKATVEQYVN